MTHWPIVPVLLPLVAAVVLLLLERRSRSLQRVVSIMSTLAGLLVAVRLLLLARGGACSVYHLGSWPSPFGIVLVVDRLSAVMVLLTGVVALSSVLYAVAGADNDRGHFHALFHLQLAGLAGAFLTGDLFNLYVFFELLLIASFCLLLQGVTGARLRAGLPYVVINVVGSLFFLVGIGIVFGVTGTLSMADLSLRVAALPAADAGLVRAGALLLLVVFVLKAALVPLYFWLPRAYSAASAPVAALFAIMTKVGVYAIVRMYTLVFGAGAGVAADVALPWLLPLALATIVVGMLGAVASERLRDMQGYLLIGSLGIMLASIGLFTSEGIAAGLYYLVHSTITIAAMFLLVDVIARQRGASDERVIPALAVTQPAVLGTLFFAGALAVAGLPPLSGFIGKLTILQAAPLDARGFWLGGGVLGGSLLAIVALARAGSTVFWNIESDEHAPDDGQYAPDGGHRAPSSVPGHDYRRILPVIGLLGAVVLLTVFAEPAMTFATATADQLLHPAPYVRAVLLGR